MKVQKFSGVPFKGPRPGLWNKFVWTFFGNDLDGYIGDNRWNPEQKDTAWIRIKWWLRNPMHNLTWHVIGFAQHPSTRYDEHDEDQPGWNRAWSVRNDDPTQKKYRYWLYKGTTWTFYAGYRGRGNFGFKFNRTK